MTKKRGSAAPSQPIRPSLEAIFRDRLRDGLAATIPGDASPLLRVLIERFVVEPSAQKRADAIMEDFANRGAIDLLHRQDSGRRAAESRVRNEQHRDENEGFGQEDWRVTAARLDTELRKKHPDQNKTWRAKRIAPIVRRKFLTVRAFLYRKLPSA